MGGVDGGDTVVLAGRSTDYRQLPNRNARLVWVESTHYFRLGRRDL